MWRGIDVKQSIRTVFDKVEWGDLDYLIIDLPPGTGDIQMALK